MKTLRALGTVIGIGIAATLPLAAAADAPATIAILGSSTAAGTGATNYDSAFAGRYGRYLAALRPAWNLVNLGVGGYTTYNVMPTGYKPPANRPSPDTARNITKVLALHPHALLICLPSNDINNGYPASEYNANFDSLRLWAARAGIQVWVSTPLPRSALDSSRRVMLIALRDRILSRYAPRAIDFYDSLGGEDGRYFPAFNSGDGIHTNDRGHKILFLRVVAANLTGISTSIAFTAGSDPAPWVASGLPKLILGGKPGSVMVEGFRRGIFIDLRGRTLAPGRSPAPWRNAVPADGR
ncbi:MAG: lipolytic protein family [Fibrobacteres bacterium]|nr:lipolytic protein family [Fibrobacterota bacterium]